MDVKEVYNRKFNGWWSWVMEILGVPCTRRTKRAAACTKDLHELAREVVESQEENKDLDLEKWAENLSSDLVSMND